MKRQQSIYGEMKVEMKRRRELEKEARIEMAAAKGRAGERNKERNRHTYEINRLSRYSCKKILKFIVFEYVMFNELI